MSSSTTYNPHPTSSHTIPLFDANNFPMWKTKAMAVLETLDYDMLQIVTEGPHVPMFQPMKDGVAAGEKKLTPRHEFTAEDKRLCHLDKKACAAIGNSLPYEIYHLVQNCESTKEMMDILTVAFEGTKEVQRTNINNLKRKYEHFFAQKGETLTDTFNRFNCLINDMKRLTITKHKGELVLKFLDSLGEKWEHHADVLKNREKLQTMDLQSLFGNLRNFEETKALRKEIMRDSHSNKSVALYTSKKALSDSDEFSEEEADKYEKKLVESAALIVKHFHKRGDKWFGTDRSFSQKSNYSRVRDSGSSKRPEKKEDRSCFNCGSPDHFARDCKKKKKSTAEESYEVKYKKLLASLKRQNVDVKAFVAEEEKETWEEEEASSEEEESNDKCLMAKIEEEGAGKENSYEADLSEATRDSKMSDWDSTSLYQVNKFVSYYDNEKNNMFDYLCLDLSKSNSC